MAASSFIPLAGRLRRPPPDGGTAPAEGSIQVSVFLRRRQAIETEEGLHPRLRRYLLAPDLAARHGADPADLEKVCAYARGKGLTVVNSDAVHRRVVLAGPVSELAAAFNVEVVSCTAQAHRVCRGPVQVPAELAGIVVGVFGFDSRPVAKPHLRRLRAATTFAGYSGSQVGVFYNFPAGADGSGQTIGIIELGGGFRTADITSYFKEVGIPAPSVKAVSVSGGKNAPTTPDGADGEVMLDIEVAGAVAPAAQLVVYFAAGATDQDFINAISDAVHDTANNPSVISISWGGPESSSDQTFQTQFDEILKAAAALGITVTVASGDSGAADEGPNEWDGKAHVDFPASSPNALGCGGTNITVSGNTVTAESVWNENVTDTQDDSFGSSGGGISEVFPVPSYQSSVTLPANVSTGVSGRGVPDVSGDGDPASGYRVRADSQEFPVGGTSAVAPLWAGLVALLNQNLSHRVGLLNPFLYANPSALVPVTKGDNKVGPAKIGYSAGSGWSACAGLGRPDGMRLLGLLSGSITPARPQKPAHPAHGA
jgi:kumamolisin